MTHTTEANQSLDYTAGDVVRELCTALDEEWHGEDSITLHRPGHGLAVRLAGTTEYGLARIKVWTPAHAHVAFTVSPFAAPLSVAVAGVRAIIDAQLDAIQAGAARRQNPSNEELAELARIEEQARA